MAAAVGSTLQFWAHKLLPDMAILHIAALDYVINS